MWFKLFPHSNQVNGTFVRPKQVHSETSSFRNKFIRRSEATKTSRKRSSVQFLAPKPGIQVDQSSLSFVNENKSFVASEATNRTQQVKGIFVRKRKQVQVIFVRQRNNSDSLASEARNQLNSSLL